METRWERANCPAADEAPRPSPLALRPRSVKAGARPALPVCSPGAPGSRPQASQTPGTRAGADLVLPPATDTQETRLEVRWLCHPPQHLIPASQAVVVFNWRVRALKTGWLRLVLVGT